MPSYRKQRQSFNEPGHAHFLTFSCVNRWQLLSKDRSRQWFIDSLDAARTSHDFDVWAYVIMPEHAHLLIRPRMPDYSMAHILAAIKRPAAAAAHLYLETTKATQWLKRLTIRRGDKDVFRFWLPGGGFDHNLWNDRPVEAVVDYIHANPVRRGLVQRPTDWRWSSARRLAGLEDGPLTPDPIRL